MFSAEYFPYYKHVALYITTHHNLSVLQIKDCLATSFYHPENPETSVLLRRSLLNALAEVTH